MPLSRFVLKSDGSIDPPMPPPQPLGPGKTDGSSRGYTTYIVFGVVIVLLAVAGLAWQQKRVSLIRGRQAGELASNSDYSMLSNTSQSRDLNLEDENTTLRKKYE